MEELVNKLNSIPDSYFGFVAGVVAYVKKKPSRIDKVMTYLNENDGLSSSDVLKFIADQPDFNEFNLGYNERAYQS
ncbi:MAG: hypothetical protein IK142_00080 [Clostridiales bacterium]|nr:hypothetical protein [Clostridiales bacterium]